MTSTTDQLATLGGRRTRLLRFVAAASAGALLALVLTAVLALAYEARFAGRILPGVTVGRIAAGDLTPAELADRLRSEYAALGEGSVVVTSPTGTVTWSYAELGRAIDADRLAAEALTAGRPPDPLARLGQEVRLLVGGLTIPARPTFDGPALERRLGDVAERARIPAVDATVVSTDTSFRRTPAADGRAVDPAPAIAAVSEALGRLDAPTRVEIELPALTVEPAVTDSEALVAEIAAGRMSAPVVLAIGDERWTLGPKSVRGWLGFATTPDGRYEPTVDRLAVQKSLTVVARKVFRDARDASFLIGKDKVVVGVEPSVVGRVLDVTTSSGIVAAAVAARAGITAGVPEVAPAVLTLPPRLPTDVATAVAPEMAPISSWETYYPIGIKNGFGANIEIPTQLIDGMVVPAGGLFDFWAVTGEPTADGGYKQGAAIIDGRTEPQGALAGGICSCSTTLFNAALRAGYAVGARMNHYYYIDRYPLGLDATVFISSGGWRQTMSWTNDTEYPVLIKGSIREKGDKGWVRFELWSVPTGRTVELSEPIVKNVRRATTITEETADLTAGTRKQVEWPADGKDVWVTRIVRDRDGTVIHTETFYSHYARVDGIIQVGTGTAAATPPASPAPAP